MPFPVVKRCNLDIGILVDSTASMRDCNYGKEKDLVKDIAEYFQVAPGNTQASIVLYSDDAVLRKRFDYSKTLNDFKNVVDNLPMKGGATHLDKAMHLAASSVFTTGNGMRRSAVPKILFVLTDGVQASSSITYPLRETASVLHDRNIKVVVIGSGEADRHQLSQLVQSPDDLIMVERFEDAREKVANVSDEMCHGMFSTK